MLFRRASVVIFRTMKARNEMEVRHQRERLADARDAVIAAVRDIAGRGLSVEEATKLRDLLAEHAEARLVCFEHEHEGGA